MKKGIIKSLILIFSISVILYTVHTFAMFRSRANTNGSLDAATWSVTRNQSQTGDSLEIIPGLTTDSYTLTIQSNSEVDIIYSIIISNLPTGVEVDLDDSGNYRTPTNGTIRINSAGRINYNDSVKTKNHTLKFRATSGTTPVSDQEIDIDVEFKQDL